VIVRDAYILIAHPGTAMPRPFFGRAGEPGQEREFPEATAKVVYNSCPVGAQCLGDALKDSIKHGIWGGLSEQEGARERHRRSRGPEAA
jgi:WhiB family transcriptional regulator, redox-sensing transcriptional regulator